MTQPFYRALPGMLLTFCLSSQAISGGISLGQTRVIFSSADKAQTITISNSGNQAYLIQTRVQKELNDTAAAPFIVTPPLFSLQGNSRQILRLLPQSFSLPVGRESLFYISVSAIPAQSDPITLTDRLSVGVRFVIKLFYRPQGLPADSSACFLMFRREPHVVRVVNSSGYFQTIGMISFDKRPKELVQEMSMVPPYGSIILPFEKAVNRVDWQTLNDFGGLSDVCHQAGLPATEVAP
ncbi:molecular chaperone [Pantoea deleyi]|uniref:fimbrial biogenesis chaperone n=1 Tax=Pantoea deleyi TaxID=470932 RepID=UPI0035D50E62